MCCHCEMYLPHSLCSTSKSHSKCKSSIISPLLQNIIIHLYALVILRLKLYCQDIFMALNFIFFLNSCFNTFSLAWKANVSLYWFYSSPLANIDFPSPPELWINQKLTCLFCSMTTVILYHLCPIPACQKLHHSWLGTANSDWTLHKATFTRDTQQTKHLRGYVQVLLFASITSLII